VPDLMVEPMAWQSDGKTIRFVYRLGILTFLYADFLLAFAKKDITRLKLINLNCKKTILLG